MLKGLMGPSMNSDGKQSGSTTAHNSVMGQKMSDVINGLVGPLIKDKTTKNKERKNSQ